jgi:hypothetical protein
MSEDRKKKDGERKEKITRRSKEAQEQRHRERAAQQEGRESDQGDIMEYKPGAASDRTRRGAT